MKLAWIRLAIAITIIASSASAYFGAHLDAPGALLLDAATFFYPVILVGLAARLFWARFLTLCFAAGMVALHSAWGSPNPPQVAAALGLVMLLSGRSMVAMFEGRSKQFGNWAQDIRHLALLKAVFALQAVALGVLFPAAWLVDAPAMMIAATTAVAALGIVGLVFQRTWGLLAMPVAIAMQAWLAATSLPQLSLAWGGPPRPWPELLVGLAACGSALALVPFVGDIAQFLRTRAD